LAESIPDTETYLFDPHVPFLKKFEDVYDFHYKKNTVYRSFLKALGYSRKNSFSPETIPLIPKEYLSMAPFYQMGLQQN